MAVTYFKAIPGKNNLMTDFNSLVGGYSLEETIFFKEDGCCLGRIRRGNETKD
jgi:hypothetical protein